MPSFSWSRLFNRETSMLGSTLTAITAPLRVLTVICIFRPCFGMCRQTTTNSTDQSFNSKSSQILVHNSLKNYCSSHKSQKVRTRITSKGCYVEQKKLNLFYQLFNHIFYLFYSFNTASPGRQSMLPVGVDPSFGLRRPLVSALPTVHTSIFTEMSRLAAEHGAINLSQGFPDFPPDPQMTAKLEKYSREGHNQFAPTAG
eukprot:Selendium_serpulae@DN6247_c0_g4_i2.p1